MRRPVHGQHDGDDVRADGNLAHGVQRRAGGRPPEGRGRVRDRETRHGAPPEGRDPAPDLDPEGILERHRGGHGDGWVDERRAPSPRGGAGSGRQAVDRRLRPRVPEDARARRPEARGPVHGPGHVPGGWNGPRGSAGSSRPGCSTPTSRR